MWNTVYRHLSLPSIALLSTICHHLLFRERRSLTRYLLTKFSRNHSFSLRPTLKKNWQMPGPDGKVYFRVDKGSVFRHDLESAVSQGECLNYFRVLLCNELYIEIWDLATSASYPSSRLAIDVLYSEDDKITYCTLSRNNDLLACCVVDRILVFLFNAPTNQPVVKLPRAHLGKIEFCRFLKGNRYIISYGIDGAVLLWDLREGTAISFIRMSQERENITFMTVSPKEDKVVGCTSFGRFFSVKLFGLKSEMPSFQLKPQGMMMGHNASTLTGAVCSNVEQIAEETDTSKVLEEMSYMYPSDHSEDSDGDESENSETDQ